MKYLRSFIRFIKRPCYMFKYFKKVNKVIEAVEGKDKQELGFVNDNGVWYVDLPEWELDRGHLMMVAGADTLLDMMSNYGLGRVEIDITACNDGEEAVDIAEETKGADVILELINTDIGGLSGTYRVHSAAYDLDVLWLCPVVSFVFGELPKFFVINLK